MTVLHEAEAAFRLAKKKPSIQSDIRDAMAFSLKMNPRAGNAGYTVFLSKANLMELTQDMGVHFTPDKNGRMYFGRITAQIAENIKDNRALVLPAGIKPDASDLRLT